VIHYARRPEFRNRIVFIEDYDMKVGRYLYQGVDLWLNTPRRPLEASGTSGMKATANGAINVSILDGWWDEAYNGTNGWAIGRGEEYEDAAYQDQVESQAVYQMLEGEILPMFYSRGRDGLPREWVRRMKHAMRTVCPVFNCYRMVREYTERLYLPAAQRWAALGANGLERARAFATWREQIQAHWGEVAIRSVTADTVTPLEAGTARPVQAEISLGVLRPEDVSVVLYAGPLTAEDEIGQATVSPMKVEGSPRAGLFLYSGSLEGQYTGSHGFRVRVLPAHEDLASPLMLNCIVWG
jgi:starch phosphorylase